MMMEQIKAVHHKCTEGATSDEDRVNIYAKIDASLNIVGVNNNRRLVMPGFEDNEFFGYYMDDLQICHYVVLKVCTSH